jgi:hypothetical protein
MTGPIQSGTHFKENVVKPAAAGALFGSALVVSEVGTGGLATPFVIAGVSAWTLKDIPKIQTSFYEAKSYGKQRGQEQVATFAVQTGSSLAGGLGGIKLGGAAVKGYTKIRLKAMDKLYPEENYIWTKELTLEKGGVIKKQYGIPTQKGSQLQLLPKEFKEPSLATQNPFEIAKKGPSTASEPFKILNRPTQVYIDKAPAKGIQSNLMDELSGKSFFGKKFTTEKIGGVDILYPESTPSAPIKAPLSYRMLNKKSGNIFNLDIQPEIITRSEYGNVWGEGKASRLEIFREPAIKFGEYGVPKQSLGLGLRPFYNFGTDTDIGQKQKEGLMFGNLNIPKPNQRVVVKELPDIDITPRNLTRTKSKQSTKTVLDQVHDNPDIPFIDMGGGGTRGGGGSKVKPKPKPKIPDEFKLPMFNRQRRPLEKKSKGVSLSLTGKYTSSLEANLFNIKGKHKKLSRMTGLELRPI